MQIECAVMEKGCTLGSSPSAFLDPSSIVDGAFDPWRVLVTVCRADGSCVDAARGVTATSTATGMGVNN